MELIYAGNLPDAETLRRALSERGIHTIALVCLFTTPEDAGEARRIAD